MAITDLLPLALVACIILFIVVWVIIWRRIVELKYADVVVTKSGSKLYSADASIEGSNGPVYYEIPAWIPIIGCIVKRMTLEIIQISIENYETFAKANARFNIDVSVYCRISDVNLAAQRFPGTNITDFKAGMSAIIISAIRKTTANYAIEDIISKRKEIGEDIRVEILDDFKRWGVELTNVAVETISDSKGTTVIHDISAKKEAEITSLSRQQIAQMDRDATIKEAESRQTAQTRTIEADEQIAIRSQLKNMTVAMKEQEAATKELEVKRTRDVTGAEIEAKASIQKAEGIKQSSIIKAEGTKQALALEGEGEAAKNKYIGIAAADVVKATKVAEAEGLSALADAQKKQQDNAKEIRLIEKDQVVGLALAGALQNAKIEYIGSGTPEKFMDLFSVGGGMSAGGSIGTFLKMLEKSDPKAHAAIIEAMKGIGDKIAGTASTPDVPGAPAGFSVSDITGESVPELLAMLKDMNPDAYAALKSYFKK